MNNEKVSEDEEFGVDEAAAVRNIMTVIELICNLMEKVNYKKIKSEVYNSMMIVPKLIILEFCPN